ncbi:MAG: hypothetical protein K1X63_11930 [Chitinophagales bacterium]|nr:hypothetical protein [Bacteroidota bacterium]MBX7141777.1 hypothetical protein [Chitinophagales bacterium]
MATLQMAHPIILKEQIAAELLSNEEVLQSAEARHARKNKLLQAVESNRLYYSKAKIVFETTKETLEVIDHIWAVTDNHVLLRGGITLPISCIKEVEIQASRSSLGMVAASRN